MEYNNLHMRSEHGLSSRIFNNLQFSLLQAQEPAPCTYKKHLPEFEVYTTNCVGSPEYLLKQFSELITTTQKFLLF